MSGTTIQKLKKLTRCAGFIRRRNSRIPQTIVSENFGTGCRTEPEPEP